MSNTDIRLDRIEARLLRLEKLFGGEAPANPKSSAPAQASPFAAFGADKRSNNQGPPSSSYWTATNVLGWAGATALVLAAVYFIRLAIDSGWLTPERQIGGAMLGALLLITLGLILRRSNQQYASLLPAGGVVILFLCIYGAHLYYNLIGATAAAAAVVMVCITTLWLGHLFNSAVYAMFAVIGSYSAPFLLPSLRSNITDLIVYYSAWSVLFCLYAIYARLRAIYLVALYLALLGFEVIWKITTSDAWIAAASFQFVQLIIFATGAALYSIRHNESLSTDSALAHLPALLIFYIVQYALLQKHIPQLAPWIAAGSLGFLGLCYAAVRLYRGQSSEAARLLLGAYAALVLFHAGYLESVSSAWEPWVAFAALPVIGGYLLLSRHWNSGWWPILVVIGIIFSINYMRILLDLHMGTVPAAKSLTLLYALELYAAYYFVRHADAFKELRIPLLYAGHIAVMAAAIHILDERFAISLSWGLLALGCLGLSISFKDKLLGQSSLLIFAASVIKVLLYDLAAAAAEVRIASLLVLGITLYIGGWLYQKVNSLTQ